MKAADDQPVDIAEVVRRAQRRLARRMATTLVGGVAASVLLGLGGDQVRKAVHPDDGPTVTTTSSTTTTTDPGPVLQAPALTANATGPRTARLTWTEPAGDPVRYVVYRDDKVLETVAEPRLLQEGLVPGRSYRYAVAARDAAGMQSPRSKAVTVTMPQVPPPTNLAAKATRGVITLTWRPSPDDGVVSYVVSRDGKEQAALDADTRSHRDATVEQLRTYEYEVVAVDGDGHRSAPASVRATAADAEPPAPPTGVKVRVVSVKRSDDTYTTNVSWEPSADNVDVAGYEIRRQGMVVGTVDGDTTTYADDGAHYDEEYTVVAYDVAGNRSKESLPGFDGGVD